MRTIKDPILIIISFLFFFLSISCKKKVLKEKDFIGVYVGNRILEADTIEIVSDSTYYHIENLKCTYNSKWKLIENNLFFYNFFLYHTKNGLLIDTVAHMEVYATEYFIKDETICLQINSDAQHFYKKIK